VDYILSKVKLYDKVYPVDDWGGAFW
jgi:hypothetical protein